VGLSVHTSLGQEPTGEAAGPLKFLLVLHPVSRTHRRMNTQICSLSSVGSSPDFPRSMTPCERAKKACDEGREEASQVAAGGDRERSCLSPRAAFIHAANITIDGGANPGLIG
jgi:hypothetical protein